SCVFALVWVCVCIWCVCIVCVSCVCVSYVCVFGVCVSGVCVSCVCVSCVCVSYVCVFGVCVSGVCVFGVCVSRAPRPPPALFAYPLPPLLSSSVCLCAHSTIWPQCSPDKLSAHLPYQ